MSLEDHSNDLSLLSETRWVRHPLSLLSPYIQIAKLLVHRARTRLTEVTEFDVLAHVLDPRYKDLIRLRQSATMSHFGHWTPSIVKNLLLRQICSIDDSVLLQLKGRFCSISPRISTAPVKSSYEPRVFSTSESSIPDFSKRMDSTWRLMLLSDEGSFFLWYLL